VCGPSRTSIGSNRASKIGATACRGASQSSVQTHFSLASQVAISRLRMRTGLYAATANVNIQSTRSNPR
jgi:hypothetical protein